MPPANALLTTLGLSRSPFPPTPDAGSYFFTAHLQEQFAELMHCIQERKGFVLLTGEVGLGKSTLVRRLLDTLPADTTCSAMVFNTFLQGPELLAAVLRDFGLPATGQMDADLAVLNDFLLARYAEGKTCLLVVDDAQNLTVASLELIRLLCNLETGQEKLLQILLAGQPELDTILSGQALRQLKSRVVKHAGLRGLQAEEVARYFEFRMAAAGGAGRISLAPRAARVLYQATQGNLRQIHLVLDRCLYGLAATGQGVIDKPLLNAAFKDLSFGGVARTPRRPAAWLWLAGLLGVSSLAGAAMVLGAWPSPPVHGRAPVSASLPSSPVVAASGPVVALGTAAVSDVPTAASVSAPGPATATTCLEQLAQAAPAGAAMVSQWLPAAVAERLAHEPGICLSSGNAQTWATWPANPLSRQALLPVANDATRQMQQRLAQRGWLKPELVDGLNGPQTTVALQAFQKSLGLPATGSPDELTYMLLEKLHAS